MYIKTGLKKWLSFLFAVLLFCGLCFSLPVRAEEGTASPRVIRVGFFAFDGYHMEDETGRKSGYGYDFLQMLARYGNWTYQYTGYDKSWADMQDMLAAGDLDLVTSAQKTAEREKRFAFSDRPIGTGTVILSVKSGDTRWTAGDYDSYNGMRIGLLKDSSRNQALNSFASEKSFTFTPVYYDTVEQMKADLQAGEKIDAIVTSNLRSVRNEWILDQFAPSDFYVMVRKDETALLQEINAALEELDNSLPGWREKLRNRYYQADSGEEIPFTAKERAYIAALKKQGTVINAVVEPDRRPYSYFENGKAKGIIPEIFAKIEKMSGLQFRIVDPGNRAGYFDAIRNPDQDIQVRIDAYYDFSNAEQTGYKLTEAYYSGSVSSVTRKLSAEKPETIAVLKNADPSDYRTAALRSGLQVLACDSIRECLDAVKNGKADQTYVLTYSAQQYVDLYDADGKLSMTLLPQYSISYAVGVKNSADTELLEILDKAVANLKSADIQGIALNETQLMKHRISFVGYLRNNPVIQVLFYCSILAILLLGFLLVFRQRTLRIEEKKNEELRAEALRADRANEAKSAFLQSVSHDMRTPLNGVVSFTNFAMKAENPADKQNYLKKAQQSASILVSMINDTLEVSRIESGKMELHPESVPAEEMLEGILLIVRSEAAKKNITVESVISGISAEDCFIADKVKLQEILMNLLTNAVKYTRDGGRVTLTAEMLNPPENGRNLKLVVSDTGIGISDQFIGRIYDAFSQEHDPALPNAGGSGLGLFIVRRIVGLMNGTISVQSEKGKGTVFTVCLPVSVEKSSGKKTENGETDFDFAGKKILLCEDNLINTEIARTLLNERKIITVAAENGEQGLELFRNSAPGEYAAILMDINMPVMDGYTATAKLRALGRADAKKIPVIAMTADAYEEDIKKCYAAGMNGHIAKPVNPAELYHMLNREMNPRSTD